VINTIYPCFIVYFIPHHILAFVMTTLTARDLWDDPVAVAELLQLWDDVRGSAEGGLGSGLP